MAVISMRQMLEAGVHFGHQTRRWNPKMRRFIFGERNGIYIIDLEQTLTRVETAYGFVRDLVANGGTVLFVGTKKQAQDPVQSYAEKVGMPYVNERWLGGMLTNFETISKRVDKMLEYERMKASGEFDAMIKKEALLLDRELTKLQRNLGGLRDMKKAPDCVFVVDTKKEHIAVTEANKLGIPVVAIVDTNVDPDVIQFPIPGNDDAIRANSLLVRVIADAVEEGRYIAQRRPKAAGRGCGSGAEGRAQPRRRGCVRPGPGRGAQRSRSRPGRSRGPPDREQAEAGRDGRRSASRGRHRPRRRYRSSRRAVDAPAEEAVPAEAAEAAAPAEAAEAPAEEAVPAEAAEAAAPAEAAEAPAEEAAPAEAADAPAEEAVPAEAAEAAAPEAAPPKPPRLLPTHPPRKPRPRSRTTPRRPTTRTEEHPPCHSPHKTSRPCVRPPAPA